MRDGRVKPIRKGNGRWLIRVCCRYDAQGKKQMASRQIHVDPNKSESAQLAEAYKETDRFRIELENKTATPGRQYTLREYIPLWRDSYCIQKGLAKGTIAGYEDLLNGRILPQLGKKKLRDIDAIQLNRFFAGLRKEKLSGTYQRKYYNLLHLIFKSAVRDDLIAVNPAEKIEPPKKDTKEHSVYTAEQVKQLVRALEDENSQWRAYVLLALDSQMRKGECVGLNWSDIDMEAQTITISRSCAYTSKDGQYLKEPKTSSGRRTIHVQPETLEVLKVWKEDQARQSARMGVHWHDEHAVFTQEDGKRMFVHSPTKWFPRFLKKHNLPRMNLHGLRHTGASLLIGNSMDIASVSHRLGHSRISTTLDIYSHAYEEKDVGLTDAMGGFMYEK